MRVAHKFSRQICTPSPGIQVIKAYVPLAEMFGYVKTLRSLTQGRATYSMEFAHYNCVPQSIAQEIISSKGISV